MLKKLAGIIVLAMASSMMHASENNLWESYQECAGKIEQLANHGAHAMTDQEKDATKSKLNETLRDCLSISPDKKATAESSTKSYKLTKGDPATPSYSDEYKEVRCSHDETPE